MGVTNFPEKHFVRSQADFIALSRNDGIGAEAARYGNLVYNDSQKEGAHNTPAAEAGNDIVAHTRGKYGELLFAQWLAEHDFIPMHTPFRNDYRRKVDDDDFIVNGLRVEVKAKQRTASPFPPRLNYNMNMGRRGLEHDVYVFVEIQSGIEIAHAPKALIVGWATPRSMRQFGIETHPGKRSDNVRGWTFKRYDWDIQIRNLYKASLLHPYLAHERP